MNGGVVVKRLLSVLLCVTVLIAFGCPDMTLGEATGYQSMSDPAMLRDIEESVYNDLIGELGDEYAIVDVQAVYISQEYLDELAFNSQSNVFFGYTLAELDAQFVGTRYVFTVDENGETVAREFEAYDDYFN